MMIRNKRKVMGASNQAVLEDEEVFKQLK